MALTSPDKLTRALEAGKLGGVYFLFGEEEFLKEEAAAAITAAHLDPATRDFNYDQLRGADLEPETLASIANTPPMMAEWRVLVVREAQALAANARGRTAVESLIEKPIPGLALIFVATLPEKTKAEFRADGYFVTGDLGQSLPLLLREAGHGGEPVLGQLHELCSVLQRQQVLPDASRQGNVGSHRPEPFWSFAQRVGLLVRSPLDRPPSSHLLCNST